jgi:hypothetical protein
MNSTHKILAVLTGALLLGSSVFAQSGASEAGLIGKRYAGADLGYDHYRSSVLDRGFGGTAIVNAPFNASIDASLAFSPAHISGNGYSANDNNLSATVLTFNRTPEGKAYFSATLGHRWNSVSNAGVDTSDNGAFWGIAAGYEVPISQLTAFNVGLGYSSPFTSSGRHTLSYRVEVNHWLTGRVAGVVSAAYKQINHSPDALSYTAGLRWLF